MMELVSTVTVGAGGVQFIDFTSIPQTGKDLLVVWSYRNEIAATTAYASMRLNGVTTSNYSMRSLGGNGSSAFSQNDADTSIRLVYGAGNSTTANTFGSHAYYISNYTSSTNKTISIDSVYENNATTAHAMIVAGSFTTSSPITSVRLFDAQNVTDSAQHSTASLYIIS